MKQKFNYRSAQRKCYIYLIQHLDSGRKYVGKTVNTPAYRWSAHKSLAKTPNPKWALHRAIKKYGSDRFSFQVISEVNLSEECAYILEIKAITEHKSLAPKGYNLSVGGRGGAAGISESTRRKMSLAKLGKVAHNKGKTGYYKHTEESKLRISRSKTKLDKRSTGKALENIKVLEYSIENYYLKSEYVDNVDDILYTIKHNCKYE